MSGNGESVSSEPPDKQRITHKNKRKNTLESSFKRKEIIQEIDNRSKRSK